MKELQEQEPDETPLQKKLNGAVIAIGYLGLVAGVLTFFILAVFWAIDTASLLRLAPWSNAYIRGLVDGLIIGITLLVASLQSTIKEHILNLSLFLFLHPSTFCSICIKLSN